jgi:hypothetical protein
MHFLNLYDIKSFIARLLFHAMLLYFFVSFLFSMLLLLFFVAILAHRRDLCLFLFYNSNLISSNLSKMTTKKIYYMYVNQTNLSHISFFLFLRSIYFYTLFSDLIRLLPCTSLYMYVCIYIREIKAKLMTRT